MQKFWTIIKSAILSLFLIELVLIVTYFFQECTDKKISINEFYSSLIYAIPDFYILTPDVKNFVAVLIFAFIFILVYKYGKSFLTSNAVLLIIIPFLFAQFVPIMPFKSEILNPQTKNNKECIIVTWKPSSPPQSCYMEKSYSIPIVNYVVLKIAKNNFINSCGAN